MNFFNRNIQTGDYFNIEIYSEQSAHILTNEPEKFLYVYSADQLRQALVNIH